MLCVCDQYGMGTSFSISVDSDVIKLEALSEAAYEEGIKAAQNGMGRRTHDLILLLSVCC